MSALSSTIVWRMVPVLLGLVLASCGAAPDDRVTLEFWGMGREGEVVAELMPAFEREHPGIRVEVQQLPWSAAHEKLLTAYAGDATPDLCQLGNTWVPELAALNALEPLGPYLDRSVVVDSTDYFGGIWSTNVIDGTLYGIPWYVDTRLLFYRKDLLARAGYDAPPDTWAAWEEALRRIKVQSGGETYGILLPTNEFEPVVVLFLQMDEPMLKDDDTRGNFESDALRRAFTFYIDLFRQGLAPKMSATQISNVWQEFANGFFAFYITGPWNIGEFQRRLPDSLQQAWMTAPMPGPDGPGASTAGGSSLAMFRGSRHKEAAWQLMEYLSRPENQVRFHELTGNLPSRESAWEDSMLAGNVYAQAFREQLQRARPAPKVPEWERIAQTIRLYAERVVQDQMTIDEALAALDRDVDQILEKRRWLISRDQTRP